MNNVTYDVIDQKTGTINSVTDSDIIMTDLQSPSIGVGLVFKSGQNKGLKINSIEVYPPIPARTYTVVKIMAS